MDSILQGTAASLRVLFTLDGVATDPAGNAVTVTIARADGSEIATDAVATKIGTGQYGYTLSGAQTATLDILTAAWTGTISSVEQTLTTRAEIVGGHYFTVAEALALSELAEKTAAEIVKVRSLAEQAFEDAAGVAFVRRYHRTTLNASRSPELALPKYPVRSLRDVTEVTALGGTPADVVLSGLALTRSGIYRQAGWTAGPGNVVVGYEYGYDRPPERVARAVLLLAKNWLVVGPIDDRATSQSAGEAGGVITLATPGVRDDVFGIPEVDATLKQYGIKKAGVHSIPLTADSNSYYRSAESAWQGW